MSLPKYELIDSGGGRKLERVGDVLIDRQSNAALWKKHLPDSEWKKAIAIHHRSEKGEGRWEYRKKVPESWNVLHGEIAMKCKLTGFGHLGFFAEQAQQWKWFQSSIQSSTKKLDRQLRLINLFGYTGGSSVVSALAGALVTHVDAAHGIVDWGKEIAALNNIPENSIRWIVDDCLVFLKREQRRAKFYDGVIMDPPSFGRGPKKEVWKIEEQIAELLDAVKAILEPNPQLIHFSSHSTGFSPEVLKNLLSDAISLEGMQIDQGEMLIPENSVRERNLPSGMFVRALRS